jgi:hypothetical protein
MYHHKYAICTLIFELLENYIMFIWGELHIDYKVCKSIFTCWMHMALACLLVAEYQNYLKKHSWFYFHVDLHLNIFWTTLL